MARWVGHHLSIQFQKVHMTVSYKSGVSVLMGALLATLAACGGGGGGGDAPATPAPTPTTPVATTPDAIALEASDSFTFAGYLFGDGSGTWSGGDGGDGGSGDGGGAGGDGEFIKVNMKFPFKGQPTGTLTWKVLRSKFGITGNTGTLSIEKDTSGNGGYKITAVNGSAAAVRATQGNFFVSSSGQLSGTFPLPIGAGGSVKDVLFNGVRFADAKSSATDFSEFAGQYAFAVISNTVGTGANSTTGIGVAQLNADGTGRICDNTFTFSATCTNGLDIVATYNDTSSRNLIRFKAAPTQSQPLASGNGNVLDALVVVRHFGTADGVSMTGDFVTTGNGDPGTTGAFYGSRIRATPVNLAAQVGAFTFTGRIINFGSISLKVASNFVGADLKGGSESSKGVCANSSSTSFVGPVNGVTTVVGGGIATTRYSIVMDVDMAVHVNPGTSLGFLRRFSTDPAQSPCQPS